MRWSPWGSLRPLSVNTNPRPELPSNLPVDVHKASVDVSEAEPQSIYRGPPGIAFPDQVPQTRPWEPSLGLSSHSDVIPPASDQPVLLGVFKCTLIRTLSLMAGLWSTLGLAFFSRHLGDMVLLQSVYPVSCLPLLSQKSPLYVVGLTTVTKKKPFVCLFLCPEILTGGRV